jgi:uncharacterized membrane protein (UPF0127 family)
MKVITYGNSEMAIDKYFLDNELILTIQNPTISPCQNELVEINGTIYRVIEIKSFVETGITFIRLYQGK